MGILSFFTGAKAAEQNMKVGTKAPKVEAKNQDGENIKVNFDSGYTFIYFYPKADTPGCTAQACSLRDAYEQLEKLDVDIYGVSTDSPKSLKAFKDKYKLPFVLLSDSNKAIAKAFDVPVRMGFSSRQAFLFKDGKLVWLDRSASTKKQAEDVLSFIQSK